MTEGPAQHRAQGPRSLSKCVCTLPCLCAWARTTLHGPTSRAAPAICSVPMPWLWAQASVHPLLPLHLCEPH